jgi:uncharacterized membrane protein YgcG
MSKRRRLGRVGLVAAAGASLSACSDVPSGTVNREVFGGNSVAEAHEQCVARYGNPTLCEMMPAERAEATQSAGATYHRPFYSYGPWYNNSGIIMPGGMHQPLPATPSRAVGVKSFDSITKAPVGIAASHNAPRTAFTSGSGVRASGFGSAGGARGGGGVGGGGGG